MSVFVVSGFLGFVFSGLGDSWFGVLGSAIFDRDAACVYVWSLGREGWEDGEGSRLGVEETSF